MAIGPLAPPARAHRAFILLVVLFAGCAERCGKKDAAPARAPESFVAAEVPSAAVVPSLGRFVDRLGALLNNLGKGPGGDEIAAARASLVAQLGFDPLDRAQLEKAGVDLDRGMAIFLEGGTQNDGVLLVGAKDPARLGSALGRLAKDRMQASAREEKKVGEARVITFAAKAGEPPALSYALSGGYLALSSGPGSAERVTAVASRAQEQSLGEAARWKRLRIVMGERDLMVVGPPRAGALPVSEPTLGVNFGAKDVSIRAYGLLAEDLRAKLWRSLPGGGGDLVARLPAQASIYLRVGVSPRDAFDAMSDGPLARLGAITDQAKLRGIDLRKDLLDLLAPGVALSLSLQPSADLSQAMVLDPARKNPFSTWRLEAVAAVTDAQKVAAVLERLGKLAPAAGAKVSARTVRGLKIWTASYKLGEGISWALLGDTLLITGGAGVMEAALARISSKDPTVLPFGERGRQAMTANTGAALGVDFAPVAAQVAALPPEAFGSGPSGMMAQSIAQQILEPLKTVKATFSLVPAEQGAALDANIELE